MPDIEPGQVWWCDGLALSFEVHFKRRPVLVLGVLEESEVMVAPLSSKQRFGQEQAVTHDGGISYLTGQVATVSQTALLKPLGVWEGFPEWSAAQNAPPPPSFWTRLRKWFSRR